MGTPRAQTWEKVTIADGGTKSGAFTKTGQTVIAIECPSGDEAVAVTLQVESLASSGTWYDVVTLSDVTETLKVLVGDEIASVYVFGRMRLSVASAVSGDKDYYIFKSE